LKKLIKGSIHLGDRQHAGRSRLVVHQRQFAETAATVELEDARRRLDRRRRRVVVVASGLLARRDDDVIDAAVDDVEVVAVIALTYDVLARDRASLEHGVDDVIHDLGVERPEERDVNNVLEKNLNKKAQLSLTNPRDAKTCQNYSNSTYLQRCR